SAYDRSLKWSLSHRRFILGVFFASVVSSVALFEIMPQDFLPSDDTGQLRGSVQTATGTSFDQTNKYVREVVQIIEKDPNVLYVQSDEGGDMTLALKPLNQRKLSADEIVTELRRKLRNIPGTSVTITNPPILRVGGRGA